MRLSFSSASRLSQELWYALENRLKEGFHRLTNTQSIGRDMPEHGRNVHQMQKYLSRKTMRFRGAVRLGTRPESSDIEPVSDSMKRLQKTGLDCRIPIFIAEPVVSRHHTAFYRRSTIRHSVVAKSRLCSPWSKRTIAFSTVVVLVDDG